MDSCHTTDRVKHHASGFTLMELLVAIAVSTILLTIGVPSFLRMVAENERVSHTADIYNAFNFARSEAIARNTPVVVCKSTDESTCDSSAEWSAGWLVYANTDGISTGTEPNTNEPILQTHTALERFTLTASSGLSNRVTYLPTGRSTNVGEFLLCPEDTDLQGRIIQITSTGRPRTRATTDECATGP